MDWPQIQPRMQPNNPCDNADQWSEATSLPGQAAGDDYERSVRLRLFGNDEAQDDDVRTVSARLNAEDCRRLAQLWFNAFTASEESNGNAKLFALFFPRASNPPPQLVPEQRASAVTDVWLHERTDVLARLGVGGECLFGNPDLPRGSIVEVSVNGARFYMKCYQIEKFLTLAQSMGRRVGGAALIINKKPIECYSRWGEALKKFPLLHHLQDNNSFCLLYWPHSVSMIRFQDALKDKDNELKDKDDELKDKDDEIQRLRSKLQQRRRKQGRDTDRSSPRSRSRRTAKQTDQSRKHRS